MIGFQLYRWDFNKIYKEELVFSGPQWSQSELINKLKELPPAYRIYSNGPDVIYFLTGMLVYSTPDEILSNKNVPNPYLPVELKDMSVNFNKGKFVLVWFDTITFRNYLLPKQVLVSELMLTLFYKGSDGTIYTSTRNLRELKGEETKDTQKQ
jgi:hypothetical protein